MRKFIYRRQSECKERYSKAAATGLKNLKGLNWVTRLTGWKDGGNITRPGNTEQIPHFICTTPIHSNCRRAWEIVPEGKKTGCKYRCASHQSTGSHRPYDLEETRRPARMREEIREHQHAGLHPEELRAKRRSKSTEQTAHLFKGNTPEHWRTFADQCKQTLWTGRGPQTIQRGGGQEIIQT